MVTAQLICAFVLPKAKHRFSQEAALLGEILDHAISYTLKCNINSNMEKSLQSRVLDRLSQFTVSTVLLS